MAKDIDANSQLKKLGSNEIQIGSEFIKFSSIYHLGLYDRDEIVIDFIDARQGTREKINTTHAKMNNKRKADENDGLLTEPPSKIIKQEELTSHQTGNEGLQDSENMPELIGPDVKEEDRKNEGLPELEPKIEGLERSKEDMKTETDEVDMDEEVNLSDGTTEELKSEIKSEDMTESDDWIESEDDEIKPEGDDSEDITEVFKDDLKAKTEISTDDEDKSEDESEDDFFVADDETFENYQQNSSRPLNPEEVERLKKRKILNKRMRSKNRKLLREWRSQDQKAGFQKLQKISLKCVPVVFRPNFKNPPLLNR